MLSIYNHDLTGSQSNLQETMNINQKMLLPHNLTVSKKTSMIESNIEKSMHMIPKLHLDNISSTQINAEYQTKKSSPQVRSPENSSYKYSKVTLNKKKSPVKDSTTRE